MAHSPKIIIPDANLRDIGGKKTQTGMEVKTGYIFRSGHLSDLEKEIVKPLMDMLRREVNETRKQTLKQIDQITQMQKETRRMMAEIEDAPIEIKIQHLVDSFNEVYEDSPPELRPPRVDRKRVEEIIHRLGFEGKGME